MDKRVSDYIIKNKLISDGDRVVLGLSGGADSVALFRILHSLQGVMRFRLMAVHVNHNVRGHDALMDEMFCVELCKGFGVALRVYDVNMEEYAAKMGISPEEAGRVLRYESLREALEFFGANKIAVAHNMNDQAETLLMRLVRGTGLKGLAGMSNSGNGIVRPLLSTERKEIERYLEGIGQEFCRDYTNDLDDYTRNRMRHMIMPVLAEKFNPSVIEALFRSSRALSEENDYIEQSAAKAYEACRVGAGKLNIEDLRANHNAVIKRVIRAAYKEVAGTLRDLSLSQVEMICGLLGGGTGKQVSLPNGCVARTEYGVLAFEIKPEIMNGFCYELRADECVYIKETGCFALFTKKSEKISNAVYTKSFYCDNIDVKLCLRSRRSGDVLRISKVGRKKLKDYFIDKKIPRPERDKVPLLVIDGIIAFVVSLDSRIAFNDTSLTARRNGSEYIFMYWEDKNG